MITSNIGNLIKTYRIEKKYSQKDLGEKIGFSARTVSDWENGKTEPNLAAVKALLKIFDVSYDEFFEQVDNLEIKLINKDKEKL